MSEIVIDNLDSVKFYPCRRHMFKEEESVLYTYKYIDSLKETVILFIDKRGRISWAHTGPFLFKTRSKDLFFDKDHYLCAANFEKYTNIEIKVHGIVGQAKYKSGPYKSNKELVQLYEDYVNQTTQNFVIYITTSI